MVLGGLFAGSCASAADFSIFQSDASLAKMGSVEFKQGQAAPLLAAQPPEVRKKLGEDPKALENMIRNETLRLGILAAAREKNWDKRSEVAMLMARAADQVLLDNYLASITEPEKGYPSAGEIERAYRANQEKFVAPEQFRVSQIFLPVPGSASKADAAKIEALALDLGVKAAAKGADFAALARKFSQEAATKEKGGDIGWVSVENLLPAIRGTVVSMKSGATSKPIRTQIGWHIVRVADRKAARPLKLEEISASVAQALRQQKQTENRTSYLNALREKTPVTVDEKALAELAKTLK